MPRTLRANLVKQKKPFPDIYMKILWRQSIHRERHWAYPQPGTIETTASSAMPREPRTTPFKACELIKLRSCTKVNAQGSGGDSVEAGEEVTSPETSPNSAPKAPIALDAKEQDPRERLSEVNALAYYGPTRRNLIGVFYVSGTAKGISKYLYVSSQIVATTL